MTAVPNSRDAVPAPAPGAVDEGATQALGMLIAELESCVAQLQAAQVRAEELLQARRAGRAWADIVGDESRPLVVETISSVLSTLSTTGHAWRREQAAALQAEDVSINRIAAMFGVSRQRISALLRETDVATATD